MRIGILSDTHNQAERTRQAVQLLEQAGAEAFIHCGDFVEAEMLALILSKPCYFVFGNNDSDSVPALRAVAAASKHAVCLEWGGMVTLLGKRIAVTHGHLTSEVRPLIAAQPDYLLTGHSHHACDLREGGMRRINPGALHRAATFSVACLDLLTDDLMTIELPPVRLRLTGDKQSNRRPTHDR